MTRIIVVDSCAEFNDGMLAQNNTKRVPFFVDVNGKYLMADPEMDIDSLLDDIKATKDVTKSAAPTPDSFYESGKGYDEVFYVTISSKLSTTYNNAYIAKTMLEEDNPSVNVHVFDSKSAACGESLLVEMIQKGIKENDTFEKIVSDVEEKVKDMQTVFVLEDISTLVKNGRVSKIKGFLASKLSIIPISIGVDGEIDVRHQARGVKNALAKTVDTFGEVSNSFSGKTLYITHVKNEERANALKDLALQKYDFKDVKIFDATGLSTVYANRNGLIMAF